MTDSMNLRSVKRLRARIAELEADQTEKATALRVAERECKHLISVAEARGKYGDDLMVRLMTEKDHHAACITKRDEYKRASDVATKAAAFEIERAAHLTKRCQDLESERDQARLDWSTAQQGWDETIEMARALTKERDNAVEGMTNNARRLVAVVESMDGIHDKLLNCAERLDRGGHHPRTDSDWRRFTYAIAQELRAGAQGWQAEAPIPRQPDEPEHQCGGPMEACMEAGCKECGTPPARCTCAYPLPQTSYGYHIHWCHCPAKAAHACKREPKHEATALYCQRCGGNHPDEACPAINFRGPLPIAHVPVACRWCGVTVCQQHKPGCVNHPKWFTYDGEEPGVLKSPVTLPPLT